MFTAGSRLVQAETDEDTASVGGLMTVFSDDFTGANNDPWDSGKWTVSHRNGGTDTIQSNHGRLLTPEHGVARARGIATMDTLADSDVLLVGVFPTVNNNHFLTVTLRGSGTWQGNDHQPVNGYYIQNRVDNSSSANNHLVKMVSGSSTVLEGFVWDTPIDTPQNIRFQAVDDGEGGVILRGRLWATGDSEPSTWLFEFTDSTDPFTSGVLQLAWRQNTTLGNTIHIDSVTVTDLAAGEVFTAGSEVVQATVTATVHDLAGTVSGTGTLAGSLVTLHALSGTVAGTGTLTGDLVVRRALSGTVLGTGTLAGDLEKVAAVHELSGSIFGTGTLAGALTPIRALLGSITGTGTLASELIATRNLTATLTGTGTLSGNLLVVAEGTYTSGSQVVQDSVAAALKELSGAITGTGTLAGDLVKVHSLEGSVTGTGSLNGDLTAVRLLQGVVEGTGTLEGALVPIRLLSGSVTGSGALSGNLTIVQAGVQDLAGSITGTGTLGGPLTARRTLSGGILSTGTLSGAVITTRGLSGTITGTGVLTGQLLAIRSLAGTLQGVGLLTGFLSKEEQRKRTEGHRRPHAGTEGVLVSVGLEGSSMGKGFREGD